MSIIVKVDTYSENSDTIKNWNCFYFLDNGVEKTIELDFVAKSKLIISRNKNVYGTVYADEEEFEYIDSIDIDEDSVFLMDYENHNAEHYKLSDEELEAFEKYVLENYDFIDARIKACDNFAE